jgi:hypothetical protein
MKPTKKPQRNLAVRWNALLAGSWDCRCGYRGVPPWMECCSSCWADRKTGDRRWAQLYVMDFRPGGDSANAELSDAGGQSASASQKDVARPHSLQ